jgi:cytochrome c oxidase subunit 2
MGSKTRSVLAAASIAVVMGCSSVSHAKSSQPTAVANGQSIFQTGLDSDGSQIIAKPPALYPKCAACHRADGSGGVHLPGGAVSADLRYKALVTDQKPPYTLALLERAISTGIDNTGEPLNPVMPHWKLSKRDLHDVAYYVLTKLK